MAPRIGIAWELEMGNLRNPDPCIASEMWTRAEDDLAHGGLFWDLGPAPRVTLEPGGSWWQKEARGRAPTWEGTGMGQGQEA